MHYENKRDLPNIILQLNEKCNSSCAFKLSTSRLGGHGARDVRSDSASDVRSKHSTSRLGGHAARDVRSDLAYSRLNTLACLVL